MEVIKGINATIAFTAELAMLLLLAIAGYNIADNGVLISWVLAVVFPAVAIVVWGYWFAPKSNRRLSQPALSVGQLAMFIVTTLLAYPYVSPHISLAFIGSAGLSTVVALYLEQ